MEDQAQIREQIVNFYKIFDYQAETAEEFGMYVNHNSNDGSSEDPETNQDDEAVLNKQQHAKYLINALRKLSRGMTSQDSGQPWFLFWNSQALQLLQQPNLKIDNEMADRCVEYLRQCVQPRDGGIAGSPYLISHIASTYAAIVALCNIGTQVAYDIVDLIGMKKYLLSIKNNNKYDEDSTNIF